jgi:hypothetical protein
MQCVNHKIYYNGNLYSCLWIKYRHKYNSQENNREGLLFLFGVDNEWILPLSRFFCFPFNNYCVLFPLFPVAIYHLLPAIYYFLSPCLLLVSLYSSKRIYCFLSTICCHLSFYYLIKKSCKSCSPRFASSKRVNPV